MNIVSQFMYYMQSRWNLDESKLIFGQKEGMLVFGKWFYETSHDKTMSFYRKLSEEQRQQLISRAREVFDDKGQER